MTREDFMENTLDVWEIPAESATRVGHPAPFPVELPSRLIDLYTYRGDLVLDPFAGSGTTPVAALRAGRHYAGYDLDESYIQLAGVRVEKERRRLRDDACAATPRVRLPAVSAAGGLDEDFLSRAVREGRAAKEIAELVIEEAGFAGLEKDQRQPGGVEVSFRARDGKGRIWFFEVTGSFTSHRAGLQRMDALWKALGKAAVLHAASPTPIVLLTVDAPVPGSAGARALAQVTGPGKPIQAVIPILTRSGLEDLRRLGDGKPLQCSLPLPRC